MNLTSLIIQLISGALGGNAAGALSSNTSLVPSGIRSPVPLAAVSAVRS